MKKETDSERRAAAKQEFARACQAEDPQAIALAMVHLALETPEVIQGIRDALQLIPYLTLRADMLRSLLPRQRRAVLVDEWRLRVNPNDWNQRTERIVIGAAMKALAGE